MTYEECLKEIAGANEDVVVMTAENRAAIRSLPSFLGDRFVDVGICEQTMIGAAAGLALRGRIPVVHSLATFLTLRAFEFVRTDVGIGNLPVKLVGGVPGFLSEANGPTHQAIEDIALMRGIPNMQVFSPSDEEELVAAMPAFIYSPSPAYLRYNPSHPLARRRSPFAIGKAEVVTAGNDLTILVHGFLLREALKAADILQGRGLSVRVLNLRTLKPIDRDEILRAAQETKLLVTIEDHFLTGGLYSIIAELLVEHRLAPRVLPFALRERWFRPALLEDVLLYEGFQGEQIAQTILDAFLSISQA